MDTTKETRFQARISATQRTLLERAAALRGITLSEFVMGAAQEAAEEVIRDREVIYLSVADSVRFAEAILNPPKPNAFLKKAFKERQRLIKR